MTTVKPEVKAVGARPIGASTSPTTRPTLAFMKLRPEAIIPSRSTAGSVGFDLYACLISETGQSRQFVIPPRESRLVSTGIAALPPPRHYLKVCSRSGLANSREQPIWVTNAPGIIDPDYTGEIGVLLYNGGIQSFYVRHGDRIAQLVLDSYTPEAEVIEVSSLPVTARGSGGFGSTGR